MCGICGYIGIVDSPDLAKMVRSISHRGPDDFGQWIGNRAGLGHTRLSVIDLTSAAWQPMATPDHRYVIVFNGEIYNYRELRRELEILGEHFLSSSDTEVILVGYRTWGRRIVEKLRGMFAFAVLDNREQTLLLARDRIGIKPLFYASRLNGLIFASEMKTLFASTMLSRELNPAAVDSYLTLGYIPGPKTIFKDINALPPGTYLEWKGGGVQTHTYWEPKFKRSDQLKKETDLLEEMDEMLNDAVRSHLVSDVPVGAFLSGGVDSSLVAAMAQRHSTEPLRTYTIGFEGGGDERHFARIVASHIGSNHQDHLITPDLFKLLPRLLWHLEQPLFDNSILPTYLVSEIARRDVKVVLSGDGGDEPFAGYDWTRYALAIPRLHSLGSHQGWQWAYQSGFFGRVKRLLYDTGHDASCRYLRRVIVPRSLRHGLFRREFLDLLDENAEDFIMTFLNTAPVQDERDRFLYADLRVYLPEDVLFKVDRMSMAHGLEVRVPFLDHVFLDWSLQLPFDMRFRWGRGKYLLRKLAARYLPPLILEPRKQGFTVPISRWLRGSTSHLVEGLFSSKAFKERGIIDPQAALKLLTMHQSKRFDLGHRVWSLFILELWARIWLDQDDYNADVYSFCEIGPER
jgi:asparagine synthase (glutamine-hydrolysing)